jgi:calcineurin-like phosphoesterase family protein
MRCLAALALALFLAPFALAAPEQVHLGLPTEDPTAELSAVWLDAVPEPDARARLDTPTGAREVVAQAVQGPSVGFVYEARFDGLLPDTAYTYVVGGRTFAFRTPPLAMADEGFGFVALGDMGVTAQSRAALEQTAALDPAFVLHAGDLSYAEGDPVVWKTWFDLVEPVAATRLWLPALGNHETYTAAPTSTLGLGPAGEIALYRQRFSLPAPELHYSLDWQGVHFVSLDTFSGDTAAAEAALPEDELAWLAQDLEAHAAAAWTIVFLHEPAYSSNSHGSSARVQQSLVPLFEQHGVDLVLQAHDHAYERTFALRGGTVVDSNATTYREGEGVVYVTTGGGGESLYNGWAQPAPAWSAARQDDYHVLAVRVTPMSIEAHPVATDGNAFADEFRIVKPLPAGGSAAPARSPLPGFEMWGTLAAAGALVAARRARPGSFRARAPLLEQGTSPLALRIRGQRPGQEVRMCPPGEAGAVREHQGEVNEPLRGSLHAHVRDELEDQELEGHQREHRQAPGASRRPRPHRVPQKDAGGEVREQQREAHEDEVDCRPGVAEDETRRVAVRHDGELGL